MDCKANGGTNVMLIDGSGKWRDSKDLGVEGSVGYGAKGAAGFEADVNKGFSTSGELGASMGVGGGFKYGFGMEKADPKKGWFDSTAEKTYEQDEESD